MLSTHHVQSRLEQHDHHPGPSRPELSGQKPCCAGLTFVSNTSISLTFIKLHGWIVHQLPSHYGDAVRKKYPPLRMWNFRSMHQPFQKMFKIQVYISELKTVGVI